jgi:hypothetical protein
MKKKTAPAAVSLPPLEIVEPSDDASCVLAWDYEAELFEKNLELERWMEEWARASRADETD